MSELAEWERELLADAPADAGSPERWERLMATRPATADELSDYLAGRITGEEMIETVEGLAVYLYPNG